MKSVDQGVAAVAGPELVDGFKWKRIPACKLNSTS
jgi:hypothetical protein